MVRAASHSAFARVTRAAKPAQKPVGNSLDCGEGERSDAVLQTASRQDTEVSPTSRPNPQPGSMLGLLLFRPVGGLVVLMRRPSLTSSLIAPAIGIGNPTLSAILATSACPSAPRERHVLPVLQRVGRARADQQRLAGFTRSMPLASLSRPASIRAMPFTQSRKLFIALPNWPAPMSPSSTMSLLNAL